MSDADRVFVEATVELAELGRFTCAPNPTVGCIVWRHGRVLGRGYHQRAGQGHAEVNAIADAGGEIRGSTVFVSLEPCAFVGRTPACAETLIEAGVSRVVIGVLDPHPQVAGQGVAMLQRAGIEVSVLDLPSAHEVIRGYDSRIRRGRPWVRVKSASSIDGGTALRDGQSQWITGAAARQDVQYWRARSDAVLTGVGTVLADDPQLNVRDEQFTPLQQPLRVVLDRHLRTPADARLFDGGEAVLLVHAPDTQVPDALQKIAHLETWSHDTTDLLGLLERLAQHGCNEVMVEAGAQLNGSFSTSALWDEWLLYLAPKWLGAEQMPLAQFALNDLAAAPHGRVRDITQLDADIRVTLENV